MATVRKTEEVETSEKLAKDLIGKTREKAFKTKVVTIIYNDKRDNNETTTAYLTCENNYFAISRIVPLGIPVELEQCLIDTAKEVEILVHLPEVKNGRPTGNHIPSRIKKYTITEG